MNLIFTRRENLKSLSIATKAIILAVFTFCFRNNPSYAQTVTDSVTLGGGYPDMVYYQLSSGTKTTVSFSSWDIGFITSLMSGSVISDPNTISVYAVTGQDSTDFETLVDTTDISNWQLLYNSDTSWYTGAFNRTTDPSNPFDFGWGVYDINSHNVYSSTLFVIKKNASYKKFLIREKVGATGGYNLRIANLDGSDDNSLYIDALSATTKNFIYFNIDDNSIHDFEPASTDWDLLFTHYITDIAGIGPYPVTGVQSNIGVSVAKAYPVDVNAVSVSDYTDQYSTNLTAIGYDWKVFDLGTFSYHIVDSLVYFVKAKDGRIYKLRFTQYDEATGTATFESSNVSEEVGINEVNSNLETAAVYPNPANDVFNLVYDAKQSSLADASIHDLTGKEVFATNLSLRAGLNTQLIQLPALPNGLYFIKLKSDNDELNLKLVISR